MSRDQLLRHLSQVQTKHQREEDEHAIEIRHLRAQHEQDAKVLAVHSKEQAKHQREVEEHADEIAEMRAQHERDAKQMNAMKADIEAMQLQLRGQSSMPGALAKEGLRQLMSPQGPRKSRTGEAGEIPYSLGDAGEDHRIPKHQAATEPSATEEHAVEKVHMLYFVCFVLGVMMFA